MNDAGYAASPSIVVQTTPRRDETSESPAFGIGVANVLSVPLVVVLSEARGDVLKAAVQDILGAVPRASPPARHVVNAHHARWQMDATRAAKRQRGPPFTRNLWRSLNWVTPFSPAVERLRSKISNVSPNSPAMPFMRISTKKLRSALHFSVARCPWLSDSILRCGSVRAAG